MIPQHNEVDAFLEMLDHEELLGYHELFDSRAFAIQAKVNLMDAAAAQPFLGWRPLEIIRQTFSNTTQLAVQRMTMPLKRHVRSLNPFMNRTRLHETVATDTMFSSEKDISGSTCAQVFYGLSSHFVNVYGMKTESDGPDALDDFGRQEGIPAIIRSDNSKMQRYGAAWVNRLREWLCAAEFTEPHHPQQNPAELRAVKWLKHNTKILRQRTRAPKNLWLQACKYMADIHNVTSDETLDYKTPYSKRRGETPDISPYLQFKFYEKVYYLDPSEKYPETKEKLGRWIGVAHNVGDHLTYVILTSDTHRLIERSVVRSAEIDNAKNLALPEHEENEDDEEPEVVSLDYSIESPEIPYQAGPKRANNKKDARRQGRRRNTADEDEDPANDKRYRDASDGRPTRRKNPNAPTPANEATPPRIRRSQRNRNPVQRYAAAATIATVAVSPYQFTISTHSKATCSLQATGHHAGDDTFPEQQFRSKGIRHFDEQLQYIQTLDIDAESQDDPDDREWDPLFVYKHRVTKHNGIRRHQVKVGWTTEEPTWVDTDAVKVQKPIILIDYAIRLNLATNDRDWGWVATYTNRPGLVNHMTRCFAAAANRNTPKYKFGVEVPRSSAHALKLDEANGDSLWNNAIQTELKQISDFKTFRTLGSGETLGDFTRIPYHIVFDVKFDLRRKARLVAGGNHTETPKEDIYSGVVDLMSVRLGFMIAAMNDLQVCAADIGNAFLYGKSREKAYVVAGKEFGDMQGKPLIIDKGLYGLRSSSARFHEHLSTKLRSMGYKPSKADTDFWIKDCGDHYEYIATYVDDVLAFGKNPLATINELKKDYILKGIGKPEYYLGGDVLELDPTWGVDNIFTALSAKTYVRNVVAKFEKLFNENLREFKSPMDSTYHP